MNEQKTDLPQLLRRLRDESGLTLRQVEDASAGRVSNAYLSQLEQGRRPSPNPRILTALAQVYRVPVKDLFEAAGYVDAPEASEIDRAYEQVLADGSFSFGTRAPGDLSQDAKRMVVELYERATKKRLLGGEDDD